MRRHDIDPASVLHMNCLRRHPTESWQHYLMKAKLCWNIYERCMPFWTEAHTKDHKRKFDILDPLGDGVIEIEKTHKTEGFFDRVVRI